MPHIEIVILFFAVSIIYASVGFGGGSSYLAILALYSLPFKEMRMIALVCNIIVVTGGTYHYIRNKQVNWLKVIPLILLSIPMSYIGASIRISEKTFFILLGISLIVASVLLWIKTRPLENGNAFKPQKQYPLKNALAGAGIGFFSGMVGIGGGIFLSPFLHLRKWDDSKKIAATASLFILVNSLSGIAGQFSDLSSVNGTRILLLSAAVFVGGQIGSRISNKKFNSLIIRRITAVLVFVAGTEVLLKHLHVFKM